MRCPNFSYEKILWQKGFRFVAGLDEVGRGAFAGPVVCGCVCFNPSLATLFSKLIKLEKIRIDDSKKLSALQRFKANKWIRKNALVYGIGESSVSLINRLGIGKATKIAFRKAIKDANRRLGGKIDYLLIDAFFLPYTKGLKKKCQLPIVHGDEKSVSIAAASIIAKVYRDNLMLKLSKDRKYRQYGWEQNKGYGTKVHQKVLLKWGTTKLHRKAYLASFLSKV